MDFDTATVAKEHGGPWPSGGIAGSTPLSSSSPEGTVEIVLTAQGSVSDYGEVEKIRIATTIAEHTSVSASAVTLNITAASVLITVWINCDNSSAAESAIAQLSPVLQNASVASSWLEITVLSTPY